MSAYSSQPTEPATGYASHQTAEAALPAPGAASATITDPHHLLPAHATEDPKAPKKGSPLRMILVVLLLILVVGFVVWRILSNQKAEQAQAQKQAAAANRPTPIQMTPVRQQTVPVFLTALGTVTAYNTVTLHTRVDGQLLQVNFREGQAVRKGQLLLQIDPRPYQATLDQALGTYAKDEASLNYAQAEAQRYTALYEAGVVSKESQQTQVSTSGQAAGTLKADQAAIEAARVNLGYTRIYSPIDGVVGLRQVDPGNIVHAADTTGLVVITQIHPIAIIFTLPEDQIPQVQQAMKGGHALVVEAYDRADSHKIAAGTLLTIDNQIDTTTGTAKLKAVFDNADGGLFANQFVNIRLILRQRPNAIIVPTAAVQSGTQGDFVYVVNSGPTPADKRKNLPNSSLSSPGAKGGKGKKVKDDSADASGGADAADETAPSTGGHGRHGGGNNPNAPKYHVDAVPVHVDFAIGVNSVLSPGAVQPGQQVVVDGAEKLVDGGNVSPQQAKTIPAGNSSGSAIGAGTSTPAASPQQPAGVNNGTPSADNAGGATPGSGSVNGGGHQ